MSCNISQSKIDNAVSKIEFAEQNKDIMKSKDWSDLETMINEIEKDLEVNRGNYTDEQVKEIGKIKGRYTALILKKGIHDFKEIIKDLGTQMDGFIEGLTDSTNNKDK
jgi:hypothetical protein